MTQTVMNRGRQPPAWQAKTVVTSLFFAVCGLLVFTCVAALDDARQVLQTYSWFKNNLHGGFTAEVCRTQIEDARLEQSKYVLTAHPSHLRQAGLFLENAFDCLLRMKFLYMSAHEPAAARELDAIMDEFKRGLVVRQEKAELDSKQHGDKFASTALKSALDGDSDYNILQRIQNFKRSAGVKLRDRGKSFFAELQRTSSNGALVAMLIGTAILLALTQRLLNERRKAEETLLISEQRIRAVVDNMFDALLAVDQEGIIRAANLRAADLLDYDMEILIGRHLSALLPQDEQVLRSEFNLRIAKGEYDGLHEMRARRKSGDLFAAEVGMRRITTGAAMSAVSRLVTIRDITQRLDAEQMRQNFIDTATQNLQSPLAEIQQAIADVLKGAAGEVSPKVLETLGIAERNSNRLMIMLNDLLDLEKLESGALQMSMRAASARDIIERSMESVRALAETQKVTLQSEVFAEGLTADPDRLVQVLVNFLSNAIKFSPPGGLVRVVAVAENGFVEFRVIDQGRGIPEEKIASVFERFKQAEASDAGKGTGLGLPICKMIVESHSGEIGATSQIGKGTTFFARIPRQAASTSTNDA